MCKKGLTVMNESANVLTRPDQTTHVQNSSRRKVLIVTDFTIMVNYGNVLQRYALQETVKSLGFDVENIKCPIIEFGAFRNGVNFVIKSLKYAIKLALGVIGVKKYRKKLVEKFSPKSNERNAVDLRNKKRLELFSDFYSQYVDNIFDSTYSEALSCDKSRWKKYDYIIAGSDQILNFGIFKTFDALRFYYLQFAENRQRVSYAPSFGVSRLKFYERHIHKKGLMGFDRFSCREKDGCEIVKELTGRNAELVLDPTLLLTAEQWRKISRRPDYDVPEHYAFCYLWHNNDPKLLKAISEIVGDMNIVWGVNPEKDSHASGPCEFLWLIDHADYVITESFHGTVFAVNFSKKFVSLDPGLHTFSRFSNILEALGLMERVYTFDGKFSDNDIDYEAVHKKLNAMREKSMQYLRECLK